MNYKLKHLSKYCCKPANETEFEAIKMAAELGGVKWCNHNDGKEDYYNTFGLIQGEIVMFNHEDYAFKPNYIIQAIDFIKKLRMTEEEAKELEDDRVKFDVGENWAYIDGSKGIEAFDGYYFIVSEDGLTVTLHKKEVK
jgi:hypothetical protein